MAGGRFEKAARLTVATVLFAASCSVFAADTDNFAAQTLPLDGKVLALFPAHYDDVTGAELLEFAADDRGGRHLRIFSPSAADVYGSTPKLDLELPAGVFGVQIADVDADHREELLLLSMDAIYLLEFDKGSFGAGFKTLTTVERLFAIPDPDFITPCKFAFDLNGDGVTELALPCWNGVRILQKKDSGYSVVRQLLLSCKAGGVKDINLLDRSVVGDFGFHLPTITAHDLNTDKSVDLLVETSAGLAVFLQTGNLQFADKPSRFLEVKPSYLEDLYFSASGLADLNNDRLVDYCRIFTQGVGREFKTVIEVFFGNIQEGFVPRPSKRIVLDEFGVGLSLVDLDGDGASSIAVATVPVTPTSLVKALLVKGMPLELRIFEADGGIIGDQPVMVKRISCGLDFFKTRFPARYVGCLTADLNSDNKNDLVVITDDDELQVFSGGKKPLFADKPTIVRKTTGISTLASADLNHDDRDDLILLGHDEDGRETVTLLKTK